jgi:hypothetical protein
MALLATQTTSLGEEAVPAQSAYHAASISSQLVSPHASPTPAVQVPQEANVPMFERSLMILLASAALGFQLRRKYKTSVRIWRQGLIDDPADYRLPLMEPRRATFGPSSAVQWPQTQ